VSSRRRFASEGPLFTHPYCTCQCIYCLPPISGQAYIRQMRLRTMCALLLIAPAWMFLCAGNARAQSSSPYSCCPPNAFCDHGFKSSGAARAKNYVDSVTFDGPIDLPGDTLQQLIASLKEKEFDRDSDWLEKVAQSLESPWQDNGYFKVRVTVKAEPVGGDDGRYAITAHLDEGLQYHLGSIDFRVEQTIGEDTPDVSASGKAVLRRRTPFSEDNLPAPEAPLPVFPVEQLRSLMPLQEGEIISAQKVREGIAALNRLYGEHGYINFVAQPLTEIDDAHQIISIRFELVEDKQYRFGKIEASGLDAHMQRALIWRIKTGDIFNSKLLQAFFDDNQSSFPAGSYWAKGPQVIRHSNTATVDVEFTFGSCPGASAVRVPLRPS
jgi:hypothetical protein